jgi:dienelactone hydrolase
MKVGDASLRQDVCFRSGGVSCAAWLYRPAISSEHQLPCVVMAQGFGGTREMRLWAYAERFVAAGYAVLAFDYRHFGGSEGMPRQLLHVRRQLTDWTAAIAFARSLAGIDPSRIVLWGSSLSGGHVIELASRDARIAAVVAQAPHTSGRAALKSTPFSQTLKLTAAVARDLGTHVTRRLPFCIPIVGAPGELAAITTEGAREALERMRPPGFVTREDVAARALLEVVTYSPGPRAAHVRCPLLVLVADQDLLTPAAGAVQAAKAAPKGELRRYPVDHFDLYTGATFELALADMLRFLQKNVPLPRPPAHARASLPRA